MQSFLQIHDLIRLKPFLSADSCAINRVWVFETVICVCYSSYNLSEAMQQ